MNSNIIPKHKEFYLQSTKGYWTPEKDKKLIQLVKFYGGKLSWNQLAFAFPGIKGKHIRERYRNHLDPNLRQTEWTWEEDQVLKKCYIRLGNCWEQIARHLPGRSANQVKNRIRKKQFRDLFKPTEAAGPIPKSYMPQNFKRPTILEQQTRIQLKKEHNNKLVLNQIEREEKSDLREEVQMPLHMVRTIQKEKKKQTSKAKRLAITLLHLNNTCKMIRQRRAKNENHEFFSIFLQKSKKQIFTTIKKMQWIMSGIWPMLTNRNNTDIADQEIAYMMFRLVEADTPLSYKILHRLIKCDSEDYLVRKFSNLVEEMGDFINFVSKTVRDKEILEGSNMDDGVKIDIENDDDEDDMSSKKERKDQIKIQEGENNLSQEKESEIIQIWRADAKNRRRKQNSAQQTTKRQQNSDQYSPERTNFLNTDHNQYDLAMLGKELTVGSEFDPELLKDTIKRQHETTVKVENQPKKGKRSRLRAQVQQLLKDNASCMSRDDSEYQMNDLDQLLMNSEDNSSRMEGEINDQSEGNDEDILNLDFDIDIEPMNEENKTQGNNEQPRQNNQNEQGKGGETNQQNQESKNDKQLFDSEKFREILRKKIKEIDSEQIKKIDLEDIQKARLQDSEAKKTQAKLQGEKEGDGEPNQTQK